MLALLSPAKSLDFDSAPITQSHSMPSFLDDSEQLIEQLRDLSPERVSELMGISAKLGVLNSNRYLNWSLPFSLSNSKQAVLAFTGDVYTGLDASHMNEDDLNWAQDHLRILSGLYGVLRPLDLIQPYRLEMSTKLNNSRGPNLYRFWGTQLTDAINQDLSKQDRPVLINLASNEYYKALQPDRIQAPVITPVFKDWKNGQYKIISFFAKKARGMMSAFMIRQRLRDAEDLKAFQTAGYAYSDAQSSESQWVFLRKQSA